MSIGYFVPDSIGILFPFGVYSHGSLIDDSLIWLYIAVQVSHLSELQCRHFQFTDLRTCKTILVATKVLQSCNDHLLHRLTFERSLKTFIVANVVEVF